MSYIFHEFLYRPLLNLLFLIYNNVIADLGIAIILLTLIIRFVLLPIFYKSAKDQTLLQKIAPKIKEVQSKHKDNKEEQVKQMMAIYKEHKVNPFSSFLLLFLQLPILFALYRVFLSGFSEETLRGALYSFVQIPTQIHYSFLGLTQLNEKNMILVIVAAVFQYLQSYLLMNVIKRPKQDAAAGADDMAAVAERLSRKMILFTPILTFVILLSLPAAVALYWLTTSAFSTLQQVVINKKINSSDIA